MSDIMMHENYQLSHQQAQSLQLELPLRAARTPSPQRRHRPASPNSSMVCDSARLASAILLGHTRCLKQYLEDLAAQPSTRRRSSSPTTNCGSIILDRREIPPKPAYDWVTVRRVLFYGNQSTEFEQDSSPLIWAVDCQEWSCLRLMCAVQNDGPSASPSIVYNPSHPQPVKRRIISSGVGDRSPTRTQGSVCCNQQAFSKEPLFPSEIDLESPACLNQGLRPLANVMLTVSFTNLSTSNMNGGGMDLRPWRSVRNSPRKSPSPIIVQPSGANRGCGANSVSLLGCGPKFSVRQLKRPTPYRTFWVRGCYTYQSLLDYFFAVGYEMVGTYYDVRNNIKPGCEHCKIDMEYFDYPNYPTDPNDMRNETFLNHFSQLELMLQSSRVSVNRLDSVIAFNALAISAGRRLAGWCCHGMEGDVTVNEDPSEPLIEWRILATLIDHGMDEFEWLEFLSPQQNLIGQALCVLAWPVHAWSTAESSKWTASICQRGMSSKYSESRRTRRRSSSPLGEKRALIHPPPFADFGVALKRQAFILLVNLWALGAFSSHHIVHRRSAAGITSGSRIWDPRPPGQRSHSYTATMDGGDLRRIMLKTISNLPPELGIEPLGFLRRWTYFHDLWRSALSGTPIPEPLSPDVNGNGFGTPYHCHGLHSPQTLRRGPPQQKFSNDVFRYYNRRSYEPISLRLLARQTVRRCLARAENMRHGGVPPTGTYHSLVGSPSLQAFFGYFHTLDQMLGAGMPTGLQQMYMVLSAEDPANMY